MPLNLSRMEVVHRFFSGTGFSYDQVARICTCGFDILWKKRIVAGIPANPFHIIDQGCGTGILTLKIAGKFPKCNVVGVELRDEYLSIARQKAKSLGIRNVDFILGRAEDAVIEGSCDCIVSSYLAKYAELGTLIANAGRMLRPGGLLIMHDFTYPSRRAYRLLWQAYFGILRRIGGRIYPEWRTVFYELPEFIRHADWVAESLAFLKENAFSEITSESLAFGAAAIVTAVKPQTSLR